MYALVLVGFGATLLYLTSQNQQLLTKPIPFSVAFSGAAILLLIGFFVLYQQAIFWVALFQAIAMVSLVFMVLPILGGFYVSRDSHQSLLLNATMVDGGRVSEDLAATQQ